MDDRQTTDWKWFQYRPIFLIAMTGVLILLIAGCQRPTTTHREEKAVNPSSSKSAQAPEVVQPSGKQASAARVFEPAIAEIRDHIELPVLLPSRLPAVISPSNSNTSRDPRRSIDQTGKAFT